MAVEMIRVVPVHSGILRVKEHGGRASQGVLETNNAPSLGSTVQCHRQRRVPRCAFIDIAGIKPHPGDIRVLGLGNLPAVRWDVPAGSVVEGGVGTNLHVEIAGGVVLSGLVIARYEAQVTGVTQQG